MNTTLIVPGLNGSGPTHWQSWFEVHIKASRRVHQADWSRPDLAEWAARVAEAIDDAPTPVWIVAHSFGCLATVAASRTHGARIAGALLVAPADPGRFGLSAELPTNALPFPTVLVASTNDPWARLMTAGYWAHRWGSHFINIGAAGHINVDAGYGPWPEGLAIFDALQQGETDLLTHPHKIGVHARPHRPTLSLGVLGA